MRKYSLERIGASARAKEFASEAERPGQFDNLLLHRNLFQTLASHLLLSTPFLISL